MKYHELQTAAPKSRKRVGRGTKGQKARAGSSAKPGFAGGSNPLMQKLPKLPGFKSHKTAPENIYTGQLEQFSGKTVDAAMLAEAKLISNPFVKVKLISKGELTKKVIVKLPSASESAIAAVQSAGGSFEKTARLSRPKTSTKNADKK